MSEATKHIIYIKFDSKQAIKVAIPFDRLKSLTSQWLLSETITRLKKKFPEETRFNNIVALQTVKANYAIDYCLCSPDKSLDFLLNGIVLKPFYKQKKTTDETKISLDDFVIETKLGNGSFANVYLVRKKDTGMLYALKQMKKSNSKKKLKIITRERQAMIDINSPFVTMLRACFQTKNHVYFVQDFIPGGDMHDLLCKRDLTEDEIRFFIAETILGLSAIHSAGYIYRDLKPENLLLDLEGHVYIADFGFAKKVKSHSELNFTVCGTPDIFAPEIEKGKGYTCKIDYYNLGTLAYELATKETPVFKDEGREFKKELNPAIKTLSPDLQGFILKLLHSNPQKRLGSKRGFSEICEHKWMSSMNMSKLTKPPFSQDPASFRFKKKSFEIDNIDKIQKEDLSGETEDFKDIPDFSFYDIEFVLSDDPFKLNELNSTYSTKSNSPSSNLTTTKSAEKNVCSLNEIWDDEESTVPDGDESIGVQFENYKAENPKSMKDLNFVPSLVNLAKGK